jgi:hypothetical protein
MTAAVLVMTVLEPTVDVPLDRGSSGEWGRDSGAWGEDSQPWGGE